MRLCVFTARKANVSYSLICVIIGSLAYYVCMFAVLTTTQGCLCSRYDWSHKSVLKALLSCLFSLAFSVHCRILGMHFKAFVLSHPWSRLYHLHT